MKKILIVLGSNREGSFNLQIARVVADYLNDKAKVAFLDYKDVPFINQDAEYPAPASVARVRAEVEQADGLWIISPEYNGSYPGLVKNLLDWLSRPVKPYDFETPTLINGKKVTVSGIGGNAGTAPMRAKMAEVLAFIRADRMKEPEAGLVIDGEAWGTGKLTLSDEQRGALKAQADAFLKYLA